MDQVIDETDLLQRCMNDPEFVRQMLGIFREHAPRTLRQLHDAVDAGDWPTAARHAHTLKGSAGNVAAQSLREAALKTEKTISAGNYAEVPALLEAVDDGMALCLARIKELLAK